MNAPEHIEKEMAEAIARINRLRDRLNRNDLEPREREEIEEAVGTWRVRLASILAGGNKRD